MSAPLPERVRVVEVGPRDGLQNEPRALGTRVKLDFVEALAESGLTDIEVSSFVRPDRVPQLADADEVFAALDEKPGVRYWALVPNETGLRRALEVGVRHIAVLASATEGFSRANVNAGAGEALTSLEPVVALARHAGAEVRGYVSTVFGCPYDGEVPPRQAARATKALFDMGCSEVSLGDTIGVAVPTDIPRVLEAHDAAGVERSRLALHLHDTRGTALANVWAGLTEGITVFDASAGGLGGCPFAPGAAGNLATEDLLHLLHGTGIGTEASLSGVARASGLIGRELAHPLPSRALAAFRGSRGRASDS